MMASLPPLVPPPRKRHYTEMRQPPSSMHEIASVLLAAKLERSNGVIMPGDRASVESKLMAVLIAMKPNTPMHKRLQLPSLVKKLERMLLRVASSKEECMDPATMLPRLQAVHSFRQAKRQRIVY
ncbi:hypothetical protein DYB30_007311 [Aphanomyces astaci]|uniref:Uncharacterized protein n=1 Tax=Aphanomyces astaci TaxID=112090 RepID=A0A397C2G5_APHAT|nr:hypothetical protein DYB30_007311 [Aphanomyces astaci]